MVPVVIDKFPSGEPSPEPTLPSPFSPVVIQPEGGVFIIGVTVVSVPIAYVVVDSSIV